MRMDTRSSVDLALAAARAARVDPDDLVHLARQRRSGPDLRSTRVARDAAFLGPWVELGQRVAAG
jgi:hypothetical protein